MTREVPEREIAKGCEPPKLQPTSKPLTKGQATQKGGGVWSKIKKICFLQIIHYTITHSLVLYALNPVNKGVAPMWELWPSFARACAKGKGAQYPY